MDRLEFKTFVLQKLASLGLDELQMEASIDKAIAHLRLEGYEKAAERVKEAALSDVVNAVKAVSKPVAMATLAGPPVAMGLGGLATGYVTNLVSPDEVEEEKKRQLLAEIQRLRDKAKQSLRAKRYRQMREQGVI